MAVFRIEETRDYTVMANHHLRNTALSLKAKGLLSLMLSLPEDWDYTTKGLARICRDGVDSICATVRELEDAGYSMSATWRTESAASEHYFGAVYDCEENLKSILSICKHHMPRWETDEAFFDKIRRYGVRKG